MGYIGETSPVQRAPKYGPGPNWLPPRCIVVGCDQSSWGAMPVLLCSEHALLVWRSVQNWDDRALRPKSDALRETQRAAEERLPESGEIYFVYANGLIKVGWSSQAWKRLRTYGPDAEVLCLYPGSRADERDLHRTLTPYRAAGREWYEDCPFTRRLAQDAVDRYGPPRIAATTWTRPKPSALRPRSYR